MWVHVPVVVNIFFGVVYSQPHLLSPARAEVLITCLKFSVYCKKVSQGLEPLQCSLNRGNGQWALRPAAKNPRYHVIGNALRLLFHASRNSHAHFNVQIPSLGLLCCHWTTFLNKSKELFLNKSFLSGKRVSVSTALPCFSVI